MRLRFQRGDIVAILLTVIAAVAVLLLFLPKGLDGQGRVEIYCHGELIKALDLAVDTQYEYVGAYTNVIHIADGQVFFFSSDCPGEDCVHSGAISTPGRSLVCLPNGVEVRIVAGDPDVDFVVG